MSDDEAGELIRLRWKIEILQTDNGWRWSLGESEHGKLWSQPYPTKLAAILAAGEAMEQQSRDEGGKR